MSTRKNATYSMIVAQLLNQKREDLNIGQSSFLERARLSQSSWSRINRGLSYFTLEELRVACGAVSTDMNNLLRDANKAAELLPNEENINILDSVKSSDNKFVLPTIIAGAVLGFLIFRLLKK